MNKNLKLPKIIYIFSRPFQNFINSIEHEIFKNLYIASLPKTLQKQNETQNEALYGVKNTLKNKTKRSKLITVQQ